MIFRLAFYRTVLTGFIVSFFILSATAQRQKVWLDADTGNEVDDVFAIVRLLWANDEKDIMGLSSAHFNNADLVAFEKWNQYTTPGINTVRISQGLNEEILTTMGLVNLPHPMGADRQMGRAWGGFQPRSSAATTELLRIIKALKPGEKLDILTIGATTNIASLIALDSTVKAKIRLYSLGGGYDQTRRAWNKNEFNVRCDLNAYDFLMNQTGLDWTVMTTSTAVSYKVERDDFFIKLADDRPTEQLMEQRWRETEATSTSRVLWDVALGSGVSPPQPCRNHHGTNPARKPLAHRENLVKNRRKRHVQ
jgi:hypothetical protein